jgi:hypothetical protein
MKGTEATYDGNAKMMLAEVNLVATNRDLR